MGAMLVSWLDLHESYMSLSFFNPKHNLAVREIVRMPLGSLLPMGKKDYDVKYNSIQRNSE